MEKLVYFWQIANLKNHLPKNESDIFTEHEEALRELCEGFQRREIKARKELGLPPLSATQDLEI